MSLEACFAGLPADVQKWNDEGAMRTVLLGEAPVREDGFAFDWQAYTTGQIAEAMGITPFTITNFFYVMNVFDSPQPAAAFKRYDEFPEQEAVSRIQSRWFPFRRIICVGQRVQKALEQAAGIEVPYAQFARFSWRGAGDWQAAYIWHPSGGNYSQNCQDFLRHVAWSDYHASRRSD